MYQRWHMVNNIADARDLKTYLEVGVADGQMLRKISIPNRVSVDPSNNERCVAQFRMTSDAFFTRIAIPNNMKWEVIFIDGLHHADQVERDIENSLDCLRHERSVVMLHDCNPPNERVQRVPRTGHGCWTGDVWKAVAKFRATHWGDYRVVTVDSDNGVGVIYHDPRTPHPELQLPEPLTWRWFREHRKAALGLISLQEFRYRFTKK